MTESTREIYLDNAATTKVDEDVARLVLRCMTEDYGNAASLHKKGMDAEMRLKEAKARIAETLKCEPSCIFFTSGGTESNNWAIFGAAEAKKRRGKHLITTAVEHPSVKNPMQFLEGAGFEVTYLPVDKDGLVSLEDLKAAVREDTILVSVMYVNNEIGAAEPVEEIGAFLHREHPEVLFHVDAIQAYGKYRIRPDQLHIDLLSVSGHKIHGPKGTGFLYVSPHSKIRPMIYGGGQQKGMRSGTENVPGAAGLGLAAEKIYKNIDENVARMYALKQRLSGDLAEIPDAIINGKNDKSSAPHILSCSFLGVRSEVLLHALEQRGIYVSSGSACASNHPSEIHTLGAIGLSKERQEGTIRFSLSNLTTEADVDETVSAIRELLPGLRRFYRR